MAASASSTMKYFGPYVGYSYSNQATVYNSSGAFGDGMLNCGSQAPSGYMGISSYLYYSTGECVSYSDWYYNNDLSYGIGIFTGHCYTSGKYYYAKALSQVYNGNGYTSVWSNKTPYLSY